MKKYLGLLLLLWTSALAFAQEEDFDFDAYLAKFKSTEEDQYYHRGEEKEWKYVPYKPVKKSKVRRYKNEFFEFKKIKDYTTYDEEKRFHTPYQDSLWEVKQERMKRFLDTAADPRHSTFDPFYIEPQFIGKIDRENILMHESHGDTEAFVYEESELGIGLSVWVAYSKDKGKNWSYYCTGINQKSPLFVKWYSKFPLFNSSGDLQIEACLMRKMSDDWICAKYEVVQDGLLLTIDIATLQRDSDFDGLTDILEKKYYYTNPNNPDTDGDGVSDNLDLNPRWAVPRTDKTIVYEALINSDEQLGWCVWDEDTCALIPLDEVTAVHYPSDSTITYRMVSDDPNLVSIQPINDRYIFLSSEEYELLEKDYGDVWFFDNYSPMFKTDYLENTYVLSSGGLMGSAYYYAKWTEKGWKIGGIYSISE